MDPPASVRTTVIGNWLRSPTASPRCSGRRALQPRSHPSGHRTHDVHPRPGVVLLHCATGRRPARRSRLPAGTGPEHAARQADRRAACHDREQRDAQREMPRNARGVLPLGALLVGGRWSEPTLTAPALTFEQATRIRKPLTFFPTLPAVDPPAAGQHEGSLQTVQTRASAAPPAPAHQPARRHGSAAVRQAPPRPTTGLCPTHDANNVARCGQIRDAAHCGWWASRIGSWSGRCRPGGTVGRR